MSHFRVTVLLQPDTPDVPAAIAELLAPYYAWKEVPHHETCICVSREALQHGGAVAEASLGKPGSRPDHYGERADEFQSQYMRALYDAARTHPQFGKPDPACPDCKGTGRDPSPYNRLGQWDAWEISTDPGVVPVRELPDDFGTWALVTPEGIWHERRVLTRAAEASWDADVREILRVYSYCLAAVLDCHG